MIINVNLLIVWVPMCKFSITKLAFVATNKYTELRAKSSFDHSLCEQVPKHASSGHQKAKFSLAQHVKRVVLGCKLRALQLQISALHNFVVAADNCKYLHFVCATTISLASGKLRASREKQFCARTRTNFLSPTNTRLFVAVILADAIGAQ